MTTIEFAQQGVRQPACLQGEQLKILVAGAIFTSIGFPHCAKDLAIPKGCIGISEINSLGQVEAISVIRDDCKAARKAIRLAEASAEELIGIARCKKDRDYKLGCKAELKSKVEASFQPVAVVYTLRERTLKQYTLDDVCNTAKAILQSKYNYNQLCVDLLKGKSETELLTTVEMSDLVQELVDDTIYWAGGFTTNGPLV